VDLDDLFEDNRSGLIDVVCLKKDSFELQIQGFLLSSGIP
jgi:hypothetical protein